MRPDHYTFEPATHSQGELLFLLDHLTEAPHVALYKGTPPGVNPTQIQKTLTVLQELKQLEDAQRVPWAGFEAVRDSIERYIAWHERTREIQRLTSHNPNGTIAHASQWTWDSSGGAFKYGVGADSAEMVRTEILEDGSRRAFTVKLLLEGGAPHIDLSSAAPWISKTAKVLQHDKLVVKAEKGSPTGTITCPVCERAEQYETKSKQAERMARSRMARHLKTAKFEVARHRNLYRTYFESPSVKT